MTLPCQKLDISAVHDRYVQQENPVINPHSQSEMVTRKANNNKKQIKKIKNQTKPAQRKKKTWNKASDLPELI